MGGGGSRHTFHRWYIDAAAVESNWERSREGSRDLDQRGNTQGLTCAESLESRLLRKKCRRSPTSALSAVVWSSRLSGCPHPTCTSLSLGLNRASSLGRCKNVLHWAPHLLWPTCYCASEYMQAHGTINTMQHTQAAIFICWLLFNS